MKKLLLILLALPFLGIAQEADWHPMPSDQVSYYKFSGTHISTMKIDSIIVTDTGLLYYNVKNPITIAGEDEYAYCDPFSSWLGKTTLVENDIAYFYKNNTSHPILIHFSRSNSEPWLFYTLDDGSYFEAHIEGFDYIEILEGLSDSVKYITLEGFDVNGNPSDELFFNDNIVLSKHYGLTKTIGIINGFQNASLREIIGLEIEEETYGWENNFDEYVANYQIGDEIHASNWVDLDWIDIIIDKDQTDEYVEYTYRRCHSDGTNEDYTKKIFLGSYPEQTVLGIDDPNKQGVYRFFYVEDDWQGFSQLNLQFFFEYQEYEYNEEFVWRWEVSGSNCLRSAMWGCNEMNLFIIDKCPDDYWFIEYFNNDDFTYGTPYGFGCEVGISETNNTNIQITPNPSNGIFSLTNNSSKKIEEITIYNTNRKIVWKQEAQENEQQIDVSFLSTGLYLMKVYLEDNEVIKRKIMIQK